MSKHKNSGFCLACLRGMTFYQWGKHVKLPVCTDETIKLFVFTKGLEESCCGFFSPYLIARLEVCVTARFRETADGAKGTKCKRFSSSKDSREAVSIPLHLFTPICYRDDYGLPSLVGHAILSVPASLCISSCLFVSQSVSRYLFSVSHHHCPFVSVSVCSSLC